jgi:hypothetical protein
MLVPAIRPNQPSGIIVIPNPVLNFIQYYSEISNVARLLKL